MAADVPLYIPAEWVSGYFVDSAKQRSASSIGPVRSLLRKFSPDIHAEECPGTPHVFGTGERAGSYGGFSISPTAPLLLAGGEGSGGLSVSQIVIYPSTQTWGDVEAARRNRSERGYRSNPEVESHGWRETARGNFIDANADGDLSQCTLIRGNPPSEMVALRQVRANLRVGLVFAAQAAPPSAWRSMCSAIEPVFSWLANIPARRTARP